MTRFIVGLDLGQRNDYTAAAILEKATEWRAVDGPAQRITVYRLHSLDRTRQVSYSTVADSMAGLMATAVLRGAKLVVDETGVGAGVVDLLTERRLQPRRVTITSGDAVSRDGAYGYRVPKRDLASTVALLLEQRRLIVPAGIAHADALRDELANFRVKVSLAGHDSYGAGAEWREGNHDDLVLAVALAAWYGENADGSGYVATDPNARPGEGDPLAGVPLWYRRALAEEEARRNRE